MHHSAACGSAVHRSPRSRIPLAPPPLDPLPARASSRGFLSRAWPSVYGHPFSPATSLLHSFIAKIKTAIQIYGMAANMRDRFNSLLPPPESPTRRCQSWHTRAARRHALLELRSAAPFALLAAPSA